MSLFVGAHLLGGLVMALILVVHARLAGSELELETRRADCLRDALTCRRKKHEGLERLHDALCVELCGVKASLAEAVIGASEAERDDLTKRLAEALARLKAARAAKDGLRVAALRDITTLSEENKALLARIGQLEEGNNGLRAWADSQGATIADLLVKRQSSTAFSESLRTRVNECLRNGTLTTASREEQF